MVAPEVQGIGKIVTWSRPRPHDGLPVCNQGKLQYNHPSGACLVAAGCGGTIPLKETFDLPDPTWLQFRRRFDKMQPFCRIASHTSDEVRAILTALEQVCESGGV